MALTDADWAKIHKKAFKEHAFRTKLENDPTATIREWHLKEYNKPLGQVVDLDKWLEKEVTGAHHHPPACC